MISTEELIAKRLPIKIGSQIRKDEDCPESSIVIGYYFAYSFLDFNNNYGYVISNEGGHDDYKCAYAPDGRKLDKSVGKIWYIVSYSTLEDKYDVSTIETKTKYQIYKPVEIKLKSCKKSFRLLSRA